MKYASGVFSYKTTTEVLIQVNEMTSLTSVEAALYLKGLRHR